MPYYEVTLQQLYFGQECINRWNYQSAAPPSGTSGAYLCAVGMGAIADDDTPAFDITTILGKLQQLQSTSVTFVELVVKTLYSVTDFYTYSFPTGTVGTGGGEPMSPTMALGFSSDRTRANIRRSQKRFVGLTESVLDAGGVLSSSYATSAQVLGTMMGNPNTVTLDGVTTTFNPVTMGRLKYHPPGKTTWAYKYYPEDELADHAAPITQFNVKNQARTQTSRQYGRGA